MPVKDYVSAASAIGQNNCESIFLDQFVAQGTSLTLQT
jgi:hypothetical protein